MASNKKTPAAIVAFAIVAGIFFVVVFFFAFLSLRERSTSPQYEDFGMQFNRMDVDVLWNDDRSCKITQDLEVEFYAASRGIYVDIPVNSGEKVRNLKVETSPYRPYSLEHESGNRIVRAVVGDPDIVFKSGQTLRCKVTYDYITPKHKDGADILAFTAIGGGWSCATKQATVTMTYPAAPDNAGDGYGIWIGDDKYGISSDAGINVDWSADGKTVTIDISPRGDRLINTPYKDTERYALKPFESVELAYKMPNGTLKNRMSAEPIITIVIGAILSIATLVIMIVFGKDKPLSPIVDFYPPRIDGRNGEKRHMLPVQMGKIIDDNCSAADVTSLIFYWASKGYLAIDEREDDTYFKKLKNVDAVTPYEKNMFDKLFSYAKEDENGDIVVALDRLSGKFSDTVLATKSAVNAEYKGKFYKSGFTVLSFVVTVLCAIYGVCLAMLATLRIGASMINFAGIEAVIPVIVTTALGTMLNKHYFKLSDDKRKLYSIAYFVISVLLAGAVMFIVPTDAMAWAEKIVFALCLGVSSALAPFITVRTPYYDEQLNSVLGFRNFLRDAEKERLEALLADDPQYYYSILPYANVLGVSDIWADKFRGLELAPPAYYTSYNNTSVFDIIIISRLTRTIGSSLTYVPPKANGGSFSGGGHSGGGFSGGSFGGGGGGRW